MAASRLSARLLSSASSGAAAGAARRALSGAPAGAASAESLMATLSASYAPGARRFADKLCAVTGGAGGIGEGCARQLAAEGGRVAVFDVLRAQGEEVARELNELARVRAGAPAR